MDGSDDSARISAGVSAATVAPSRFEVPTTCPPLLRTRASARCARRSPLPGSDPSWAPSTMTGMRCVSAVVWMRWLISSSRRDGVGAPLADTGMAGSARMATARNANKNLVALVRSIGLLPIRHGEYRHASEEERAPERGIVARCALRVARYRWLAGRPYVATPTSQRANAQLGTRNVV